MTFVGPRWQYGKAIVLLRPGLNILCREGTMRGGMCGCSDRSPVCIVLNDGEASAGEEDRLDLGIDLPLGHPVGENLLD